MKNKFGDNCPKCSTPWTITHFGVRTWYDCKPCGKTAEDLAESTPPPTPTKWSGASLLEEFESALAEAQMIGDDFDLDIF